MSDADDQMGGTGGRRGGRVTPDPGASPAEPQTDGSRDDADGSAEEVDGESEQSFPASDPPGNY